MNHGTGAYKEKDFGELESDDQLFGYKLGFDRELEKEWESKDIVECNFSEEKTPIEVELKEGDEHKINGITEYGYGLWTRWLWNGPKAKLVSKPAWTALTRLTINPNYEGDARGLGDRTLAIWVGAGFYHFTTYGTAPESVNFWNNVNYDVQLDGQWNYIYFSYKRFAWDKGRAIGFVAFDGSTIRSTTYGELNILHYPIQDYLYFAVGSSGTKLLKNYNRFNGEVSNVVLRFGEGAYLATADAVKQYFLTDAPKPEVPKFEKVEKIVVDDIVDVKRAEGEVKPIEFPDEFAGQTEYAVSLWYRW